jgi:hypothetical protein
MGSTDARKGEHSPVEMEAPASYWEPRAQFVILIDLLIPKLEMSAIANYSRFIALSIWREAMSFIVS